MKKNIIALIVLYLVSGTLPAEEFEVMVIEIAPFTIVKNGHLTGFSVDLMKEMDKRMQQNHRINLYPMGRALSYLESKECVLLSLIRNDVREPNYKWVGPIGSIQIVFCTRADSDIEINSIEEAKQYRIGYVNKTSGERILQKYNFTNIEPTTGNLNTMKLVRGRLDVIITRRYEVTDGEYAGQMKTAYPFPAQDVYFAFSLTTPDEVIRLWQKALDEIKADGTYEQIRKKYYKNDY